MSDQEKQITQREKPVRRLLTPFLSKKVPPFPDPSKRKPLPLFTANIFSKLFLSWLIPLLNVGYKRTLLQDDLWTLDQSLGVDSTYTKYKYHLNKILKKQHDRNPDTPTDNQKYPTYAVGQAIILSMKTEYLFSLLLKCLSAASSAFTPWVMKYLINFVEKKSLFPETSSKPGVGYAFGVAFMLFFYGLLMNHSFLLSRYVGGQSRTILTKALLEKSITASTETKNYFPNGKIISMMGADLQRIDDAIAFIPNIVSAPIPIIIGIIILVVNLKVSALAGIAVFLFVLVLMGAPSGALFSIKAKTNVFTDKRVALTREILLAMKMIKFYSWENAYEKLVTKIRSKESSLVFKFQLVMASMVAIAVSVAAITSMVAFLVLYALSHKGDAATIFSSLALFNMLSNQVSDLPVALSYFVQGKTSLTRITEFLESSSKQQSKEPFYDNDIIDDETTAIKVVDASFEWDMYEEDGTERADDEDEDNQNQKGKGKDRKKSKKKQKENEKKKNGEDEDVKLDLKHTTVKLFHDLNLSIKKGEFVVITGSIGTGKSSLLSAIFGLMSKTTGSVGVNGSMILCASPWVQNATIRENIVFGSEFDQKRYSETISVCCLKDDLAMFSSGDMTEVGERGVTLSGGQKARINLARAIYANKDIYLFDDILSAVDATVGKHILDSCLTDFIEDKTRVLATHQLSMIGRADRIIFLDTNGGIDYGTETELRDRNPEFVKLMQFSKQSEPSHNERRITTNTNENDKLESADETDVEKDSLYEDEERAVNSIPLSLYSRYLSAGNGIFGSFGIPLIVISNVISVFFIIFTNVWLSFWIGKRFSHYNDTFYIGIYIMFTFVSVLVVLASFSIMGYITTRSSRILNLKSTKMILHTPMSYMDTTPVGRILNRFTKDTNTLDNELSDQIKLTIYVTTYLFGILVTAVAYIPWFAIALPFMFIIFISIINYYQASAREVKRLEAIDRSFILNNLNEVLGGLPTIKAYGAESRFLKRNTVFSDLMNEVYLVTNVNQRWLGINLDTVASMIVLIVSLLTVTRQFNISSSSAGLLTSYMIEFAQLLSSCVKLFTELENEMNSVERVCHYAYDLEQEAPYDISETTPSPDWPQHGAISFKDINLRYREGLPLILKNLSFEVPAGSKVGICGRTGAGKSSLMTALYRIVELSSGSIEIDGIDISRLGLHQLRQKLSIIPQDPVLFKGTIRRNLDPFEDYDDDTLWDALRRSGLIDSDILEKVKLQTSNYHKFHLLSMVDDEGSNFSLGERQMIALTRSLIDKSRILVLDEATSSVDYKTDSLVQETLATEFKDSTVLCIAHRLKTILKYDKVLVLSGGEIAEYGNPLDLFNSGNEFRKMCDSSGITLSDFQ